MDNDPPNTGGVRPNEVSVKDIQVASSQATLHTHLHPARVRLAPLLKRLYRLLAYIYSAYAYSFCYYMLIHSLKLEYIDT